VYKKFSVGKHKVIHLRSKGFRCKRVLCQSQLEYVASLHICLTEVL